MVIHENCHIFNQNKTDNILDEQNSTIFKTVFDLAIEEETNKSRIQQTADTSVTRTKHNSQSKPAQNRTHATNHHHAVTLHIDTGTQRQ
jgi:hypothetical protein